MAERTWDGAYDADGLTVHRLSSSLARGTWRGTYGQLKYKDVEIKDRSLL